MSQNVNQQYADYLRKELGRILGNSELTPINLAFVCVNLMHVADSLNGLSGSAKKDLLVYVLQQYVDDPSNPCSLSLELLPGMIDTFVSVDRGELVVRVKPEKLVRGCLAFCASASAKSDNSQSIKTWEEFQQEHTKTSNESVVLEPENA